MSNGTKKYTVQDSQSGKTVTFEWSHSQEPTDADFEEVFKSAGLREGDRYVPGQMQDTRSAFAQIPNETRPIIPTPKTMAALYPFSTIGKAVGFPAAGAVIDAALPQARTLASAVKTGLTIPSSPDVKMGILRGGQALGEATMAGLSAAHPLGFAQFGGTAEAAQQAIPALRPIANAITSPVTSIANPETPFGKELAKTGDVAAQVGAMTLMPKNAKAREASRIEKSTTETIKAVPSIKRIPNMNETISRAQKYIAPEIRETPFKELAKETPNATSIEIARDIVRNAKNKIFDERLSPQIANHPDVTVDATPISDQIKSGVDTYTRDHAPAQAKAVDAYAETFKKEMSLKELNDKIRSLNAITSSYQKASPMHKALIENGRPMISAEVNAVDGLRDLLFTKLDALGEKGTAELRKDYGALKNVQTSLEKSIPTSRSPSSPYAMQGSIASPMGTAVGGAVLAHELITNPKAAIMGAVVGAVRKATIERNRPNPTIKRSFERLGKTKLNPPVYK